MLQLYHERIHDDTDSRFVVKFHGNRPPGNWMKRCVVLLTKSSQMQFPPSICARLAEGVQSLQGSVSPERTSPCKISSQSVPICRSYFRISVFIRPKLLFFYYDIVHKVQHKKVEKHARKYKLDSLRWFSQRRSPTPHFWGCAPRGGYTPKFELDWDFCTMHLPPKFRHSMFTLSAVIVLTNRQTNRHAHKQTPLKTSNVLRYTLRRWVKSRIQIHKVTIRHQLLTYRLQLRTLSYH